MMCGGPGTTTPSYMKGIVIQNKSGSKAEVTVHFQSGKNKVYTINQQTTEIQGQVDHGSWQAVDPVQNFSVNLGNGHVEQVNCDNPNFIEVRKYVIHADKSVKQQN